MKSQMGGHRSNYIRKKTFTPFMSSSHKRHKLKETVIKYQRTRTHYKHMFGGLTRIAFDRTKTEGTEDKSTLRTNILHHQLPLRRANIHLCHIHHKLHSLYDVKVRHTLDLSTTTPVFVQEWSSLHKKKPSDHH